MGYNVGNEQQAWLEKHIEELKEKYGILGKCLECARFCKNYDAPGLSLFWCGDFRREE